MTLIVLVLIFYSNTSRNEFRILIVSQIIFDYFNINHSIISMYNRLYYLRENLVTRDLKCRNGGMDSFVLVKMEGHKKTRNDEMQHFFAWRGNNNN